MTSNKLQLTWIKHPTYYTDYFCKQRKVSLISCNCLWSTEYRFSYITGLITLVVRQNLPRNFVDAGVALDYASYCNKYCCKHENVSLISC